MPRVYKCLSQQEFKSGNYKLIPIRDEDKYEIMQWRNEQIDILRQKEPLTKEKQDWYYKNVVDKLFEQEKPDQILFSFLENDVLIGYGGLVHIDWESQNGEVSFITATQRNKGREQFINDWLSYLKILQEMVLKHLKFIKIYTYSYDSRPWLYEALVQSSFREEARLKNHISVGGKLHDVLIHSYFFHYITFKEACKSDMALYFDWVNEESVRSSSFNQDVIDLTQHKKWFESKLNSPRSLMLVAYKEENPVGQIRFDETETGKYEIDFSVDKRYRGLGLGREIVKWGVQEIIRKRPGVNKVIGKVKADNFASKNSFVSAGFKHKIINNDITVDFYYLDLNKKIE